MVIAAFAARGAEDVDGCTGVGGEGKEAGNGVALVVGVGNNRE